VELLAVLKISRQEWPFYAGAIAEKAGSDQHPDPGEKCGLVMVLI
jgi:hypothetical protein